MIHLWQLDMAVVASSHKKRSQVCLPSGNKNKTDINNLAST